MYVRNFEFEQESADGRAIESSHLLLKQSGARLNAGPILHWLRCLHEFDKGIFGVMLNPRHVDIGAHFWCSFREVMEHFVVKKTSKDHIQVVHVPQFIAYTNFSLGFTSEQVVEAQHSFYDALHRRHIQPICIIFYI